MGNQKKRDHTYLPKARRAAERSALKKIKERKERKLKGEPII